MVVITACSKRKTQAIDANLCASTLQPGTLAKVAAEWSRRVRRSRPAARAADLYCGRSFREAQAAADRVGGRLVVASAGLGFVAADADVPSYSLTVAPRSPDNVLGRVLDDTTARSWWSALNRSLRSAEADFWEESGLVLVALPGAYLDMLADDLARLLRRAPERLRIFTGTEPARVDPVLRAAVMPYDDRLDGPDSPRPGTRIDFPQRALRHFVETVLPVRPQGDLEHHRRDVSLTLERWSSPTAVVRRRQSDEEIRRLIRERWEVVGGRSGRMLRVLRDEVGVACEQSRFAELFDDVKAARVACGSGAHE